ncbi:hypothetical protein [Phytohalomonas tamaricis]|uniref:hypothetical protein n=1 Tax=Phytohalomonas tamaricis TaxID=2081032 RepID=UPI00131A22DE|nr:hypothetical protein [Phytohalomonas tamaricis]
MQPNPQLESYLQLLDKSNLSIEVVDRHAAKITSDALEFILVVAEEEAAFFQLMLPNAWQASAGTERGALLDATNDVMNTIKAAKLVIIGESVHVSVEQFVSGPEQGAALIPGLMELLRGAVAELHERLGMGEAPRLH